MAIDPNSKHYYKKLCKAYCVWCGQRILHTRRADSLYCSDICKDRRFKYLNRSNNRCEQVIKAKVKPKKRTICDGLQHFKPNLDGSGIKFKQQPLTFEEFKNKLERRANL